MSVAKITRTYIDTIAVCNGSIKNIKSAKFIH